MGPIFWGVKLDAICDFEVFQNSALFLLVSSSKVANLSSIHLRKLSATDGTKPDPNIGFPGFGGLIQGQIYNPV